MIFSVSWLSEYIDLGIELPELVERLTMAGLEVDGTQPVARRFSGVVVAEVLSVEPHPNADKLRVCEVFDGAVTVSVVCGAPNVEQGMKAPLARVGAEIEIPDQAKPLRIAAAKLRGVESQGMLCSAAELGMADSSEGILELPKGAPAGCDMREFIDLDDTSIELDLTPNRGDCLGMVGLAREIAVLLGQEMDTLHGMSVKPSISDSFPITLSAPEACPRYLGRIIRNIDPSAKSPLWLQEKLRRSGLRSIDPIVDVTNYVLLEYGQPMHAFDFAKLEGHIDVRMAQQGEKLTLLDGKDVELNSDVLVIADAQKAVAMAGIMGGQNTAVSADTQHVFLESAYFAPLAVAGKARAFGMHTDASHRYERGVDYQVQRSAMERATSLLLSIVGGEAGPITEAIGTLPEPKRVSLRLIRVQQVLGIEMSPAEIVDILRRLGFGIDQQDGESLAVTVPSFRSDIAIEADLIEEVARIYGYNNIPKTTGLSRNGLRSKSERETPLARLRQQLVALGYQEVVTYSFIDPKLAQLISVPGLEAIGLQNPISEDMSVMRSSLLPGLLATCRYNANRQQDRLRLFETGLVFSREGAELCQVPMISGLLWGFRSPINWNNNKELCDFYDAKGDVESLLGIGRRGDELLNFLPADRKPFHPGQCARIETRQGRTIGHLGALHPEIARKLNLQGDIFMFELHLAEAQQALLPSAVELSRHPEVARDLALLIDEEVPAGAITDSVQENAGEYLVGLRIIDVYQGDAIAVGKKSVALGLTWQHPSRTLSDDEVNAIISSCVNALQEQFNAKLRD